MTLLTTGVKCSMELSNEETEVKNVKMEYCDFFQMHLFYGSLTIVAEEYCKAFYWFKDDKEPVVELIDVASNGDVTFRSWFNENGELEFYTFTLPMNYFTDEEVRNDLLNQLKLRRQMVELELAEQAKADQEKYELKQRMLYETLKAKFE
jgi:hypothetical protein